MPSVAAVGLSLCWSLMLFYETFKNDLLGAQDQIASLVYPRPLYCFCLVYPRPFVNAMS